MDVIRHEIVGDRVIHGEGTRLEEWRSCQILQQMPEFDIHYSDSLKGYNFIAKVITHSSNLSI